MRVLLISEEQYASQIEEMLEAEGMRVQIVDAGEDAIDIAKRYEFDLILLDRVATDMVGFTVLTTLRDQKVTTPLIMLGKAGAVDAGPVHALNAGADDYLAVPFHRHELVARINAVVRRARGHAISTIVTGSLTVNLVKKVALVNDCQLPLTGKEYACLALLSMRKGNTLTKENFLDHLYNGRDEPEMKIIDVFVCKLRKHLRVAGADPKMIQTVWGRGYVLQEPDAPRYAYAGALAPV